MGLDEADAMARKRDIESLTGVAQRFSGDGELTKASKLSSPGWFVGWARPGLTQFG